MWYGFCATDPLQHPVSSAQLCCPGPQSVAAPRRRPSSRGEIGSPQSSDNEHSSGRLQQTDTGGGGVSVWPCKSNKHIGLHPMSAFGEITHNGCTITLLLFLNHLLFLTTDVLNLQPFKRFVCNYSHCTAQNTDIIRAAVSWQWDKVSQSAFAHRKLLSLMPVCKRNEHISSTTISGY